MLLGIEQYLLLLLAIDEAAHPRRLREVVLVRHERLAPLLQVERRYEALHVRAHVSRLPPVHVLLADYLQYVALLEGEAGRLGRYQLVLVGVVGEERLHVDLRGHRHVVVGGHHLERDAALGHAQLLLQLLGGRHRLAVDLLDDVALVQQTLLVDEAAVHDARYLQVAVVVHAHRDAQRLVVHLAHADHADGVDGRRRVVRQRREAGILTVVVVVAVVIVAIVLGGRRRRVLVVLQLLLTRHVVEQALVVVVVLLGDGVVRLEQRTQVMIGQQHAVQLDRVAALVQHVLEVVDERAHERYVVLALRLGVCVVRVHYCVEALHAFFGR